MGWKTLELESCKGGGSGESREHASVCSSY